jgi:hypothetical protein
MNKYSLKDLYLVGILIVIGTFAFGLLSGYWCARLVPQKPNIVVLPLNGSVEKADGDNENADDQMQVIKKYPDGKI